MLKIAVIGLGWWGSTIIKCLQESNIVEIYAAVDIDEKRGNFICSKYNLRYYKNIEDALGDIDVDSVIIATAHGLHEEMFISSLEANKHIFCEKPFALSSKAAKRMITGAESKGIIIGIGHERRYEGALEELKRVVDSGKLGTLLHLEFNASYNMMVNAPPTGWRKDPREAPAGMMTALGVHQTDFMQTLAGPVKSLNSQLIKRSDDFPNEDVLTIQFNFKSGISGSLTSLATTPFYQRMTVFGDRGWIENREISNVDMPDPARLMWCAIDNEIHTRTFKMTNTVRANIESWASAVMGNGSYRFSNEEILHNVEILEAIVSSISSGQEVKIS